MKDKIFIDTNILVYHATEQGKKKEVIISFLRKYKSAHISVQVLNEFINTNLRKQLNDTGDVKKLVDLYSNMFTVLLLNTSTLLKAIEVKEKYRYSYYDSLIVATALIADCNVLASEDMQHNQIIESKLQIVNPFL